MTKVCLLIGQLRLGGAEKQVALLARGLAERGIEASVLVMFEGGPHEDALRRAGIPVVHLGFGRFGAIQDVTQNLAAFGSLVLYLRRNRPDVLHAFLLHSYLIAAPAARMGGIPVLVAGRRSLGAFKEDRRFLLMIERLATRAASLLIANAHAVAEDTTRRESVPREKIAVVYNGLPDAAFASFAPACVETALPVVLCVANLKADKGHSHLLDAMAQLQAEDLACTLVLAAREPEEPHWSTRQPDSASMYGS